MTLHKNGLVGIIPAYAGSTQHKRPERADRTDHPRIRGEHGRGPTRGLSSQGSSPHTRGARAKGSCASPMRRIIPAYAGSTRKGGKSLTINKDHPRIRGEHYVNSVYPALAAGSSPHTRGAPRSCQ